MSLHSKALIGLCAIFVCFLIAGAKGLSYLEQQHQSVESLSNIGFAGLNIVNDLERGATELDAKCLVRWRSEIDYPAIPNSDYILEDYWLQFDADLKDLRHLINACPGPDDAKIDAVDELTARLGEYINVIAPNMEPEFLTLPQSERDDRFLKIGVIGFQLHEPIEEITKFFEASIAHRNEQSLKKLKIAKNTFLATLLLATVILVGTYRLIVSQVISPLKTLTNSMGEVRNDQLEQSIEVRNRDEIGVLTKTFNNMAAELQVKNLANENERMRLSRESKTIMDSFPNPVMVLNSKGNLTQSNIEAKQLFDEGVEINGRIGAKIKSCIEIGEDYCPTELEYAILHRKGSEEYWYLPKIFKIKHIEGVIFDGWMVVLVDVTKVHKIDSIKTDLIGTVSHEIKTPMTSISMILHLLGEGKIGDLNQKQAEMVGAAILESEKLVGTLNSLLGITQMGAKTTLKTDGSGKTHDSE